jgi:hypothetical protein
VPFGFHPLREPGRVATVPAARELVQPAEQAVRIRERAVAAFGEVLRRRPLAGLDLADLGAGVADLLPQLLLAQPGHGPPPAHLGTEEI